MVGAGAVNAEKSMRAVPSACLPACLAFTRKASAPASDGRKKRILGKAGFQIPIPDKPARRISPIVLLT